MCMYKFYICERIVAFKKKKFPQLPPCHLLPSEVVIYCMDGRVSVNINFKLVCRVFQFTPRLLLPMQQNTTTLSKNNQTIA